MTITRTPRRWPGYRTHRRMYWAGSEEEIVRMPGAQERDFTDIIRGAKIAVEARNNRGWGESRKQDIIVDYPARVAGKFLSSTEVSLAHPADGDSRTIATDSVSPHVKPYRAPYDQAWVVVRP